MFWWKGGNAREDVVIAVLSNRHTNNKHLINTSTQRPGKQTEASRQTTGRQAIISLDQHTPSHDLYPGSLNWCDI